MKHILSNKHWSNTSLSSMGSHQQQKDLVFMTISHTAKPHSEVWADCPLAAGYGLECGRSLGVPASNRMLGSASPRYQTPAIQAICCMLSIGFREQHVGALPADEVFPWVCNCLQLYSQLAILGNFLVIATLKGVVVHTQGGEL